ncbi:MAG: DUF3048 domain-containing protein [Patescibacteria group bacterium]
MDIRINTTKNLKITAVVAVIFAGIFFVWLNRKTIIEVKGEGGSTTTVGSLTGEACPQPTRRPIAVMLASDPIARPLSGIAQADLVIEMPVTPDGVTRMMAIFQCQTPEEIGSIRSARNDFIPLAAGFGAMLAHWGGEHDALARLNEGIMDNIDAMRYEGTVFYRKSGIRPPHNGFTTLEKLYQVAKDRNYSLTDSFSGYPRGVEEKPRNVASLANKISLPYQAPFDVIWEYDAATKQYKRIRDGQKELDKNGEAVGASVVMVLEAEIKPAYDQYVSVALKGTGKARFYQGGSVYSAIWSKDPVNIDGPLVFTDSQNKPTKFAPGKMWIEVVPVTE